MALLPATVVLPSHLLKSSISLPSSASNVARSSLAAVRRSSSTSLHSLGIRRAPPSLISRAGALSARCFSGSALSPEMKSTLDAYVNSHKVVLFMKGTKEFPQCGFSNTVVQILRSLNVPFETMNILENELLRQGLKEYSNWPTFPQLYIDGEFFGGCDITVGEPAKAAGDPLSRKEEEKETSGDPV